MIRPSIYLYHSILITLLLTFFISSCSKKEHKLLKDKKFVNVLADLMIIEKLSIPESERIILSYQVFEKHHIDSTIFYETRRHYANDEKYWIKIYTKVKQRIQVKLDSIQINNDNPDIINLRSD